MDEPLSNLDAKLRVQMRTIIKKLQKELNITTIYVTHDQEEALAISDRIAIIKSGKIMQVDTPDVIYKKPQNSFVAEFIGTSNFIDATVLKVDDDMTAHLKLEPGLECYVKLKKKIEGAVKISIRPEQFILNNVDGKGLVGEVLMYTFLGDFANYEIKLANGQIVEANEYTKDIDFVRNIGDKVCLDFNPAKISLFNESGTEVFI